MAAIGRYITFTNPYADETGSSLISRNAISGTTAIGYGQDYVCSQEPIMNTKIHSKKGIAPQLYFKYIKKKFKIIERIKLDRRLADLEKAFDKSVESGQIAMGEKIMNEILIDTKEAMLYAKGITKSIEREELFKHKRDILDGHISDTKFADYTRVIPDKVLKRKKEVESVFDGFVIFHYWNEEHKDVKKMPAEEKAKMKDPVLFGVIRETDRLYFIADWEDEYCDLTFNDIIKVMGKKSEHKLTSKSEFGKG